jgi:phosphoglycerate dehydrogenase-like enzyme
MPRPAEHGFRDHLKQILDAGIELTAGADAPDDAEVLVEGRPTAEQLDGFPSLGLVIVPYAGVPPATLELLRERPTLRLHNLHHNAAPAAELAVALMLAAAKRIVPLDASLRRDDWTPRYAEDRDLLLAGRTALVIGYGAIGARVGTACRGLGMRVIGVRRHAADAGDGTEIHAIDELGELLPRADVVFLSLPTTAQTRTLLGAAELSSLPRQAILVNVARGPVVDEQALYDALRSGRLAGAGLDVWYRYPQREEERGRTPPADLPFAELDNVVMSPHRAGHTTATERLRAEHLAALLGAAARGETIPNAVDLELGY